MIKPRWARAREQERRRQGQRIQTWVREHVGMDYKVDAIPAGEPSIGRVLLDMADIDFRKRAAELRDQYEKDITDLQNRAERLTQLHEKEAANG